MCVCVCVCVCVDYIDLTSVVKLAACRPLQPKTTCSQAHKIIC
jgi:hypothetical protein